MIDLDWLDIEAWDSWLEEDWIKVLWLIFVDRFVWSRFFMGLILLLSSFFKSW
jgi:hypothetical protein